MVYNWRLDNLFPVDAQVAGEVISDIERRNGQVRPRDVVNESRPEDSVLHPCFEWNNSVAAEHYREAQARKLMGNLIIVKTVPSTQSEEPREIVVRAFINVPKPESRYISVNTAMSSEDMRAQILQKALDELTYFMQKYADLSELADIFIAIDKIVKGNKKE